MLHWLRSIVVPRALCPRHRRWGMINMDFIPGGIGCAALYLTFTLGTGPFGVVSHSVAVPALWWRWRVMPFEVLDYGLARLGCSKIILLAWWRTICWHCIWWKVVPSIWRSLVKTAICANISARRNTPSWGKQAVDRLAEDHSMKDRSEADLLGVVRGTSDYNNYCLRSHCLVGNFDCIGGCCGGGPVW